MDLLYMGGRTTSSSGGENGYAILKSKDSDTYQLSYIDATRSSGDLSSTSADYHCIILENKDRCRAVDGVLSELDALHKIALLADQRSHQFVGIDLAAGHCIKVTTAEGKILINKCITVIYNADCTYSVKSVIRTNKKRLRIAVTYRAYRRRSFHIFENVLELGSEGRVFYIVNRSLQAYFERVCRHACSAQEG